MTESASEKSIFLAAVEKQSPEERAAYLSQACGGNPHLRAQIDELLAAHDRLGTIRHPANGSSSAVTVNEPIKEGPGTIIGCYKLLQELGEGGMGTVFMAEQSQPIQRKVALKIIKAGMDSRQVIARFEAERQALAVMDHPHIAKVLDAGTTESGRPYFVMELVKGIPITTYCDDKHLTPQERLELFIPVCQAVQHAHQKGIIHRDLKPSNVLIALYDGKAIPKVIDFGVAKATGQNLTEGTLFTQVGQIVGTLEYMAPEQAELNNLDIDTRADIYSLGVLLYELLTGSTPFTGKELRAAAFDEMMRMIREVEPPNPSTRLSSSDTLPSVAARRNMEPKKLTKLVHGELDWIVMKCLEKDRGRRYETANGLAADVQRYLADEPVLAGPPSAWYRFRKFGRRNKRGLATAGAITFALLLAVGSFGWLVRDRAARQVESTRSVREFLQGSRTAMQAKDLVLARQRLAEAKVLLGREATALPDLNREAVDVQAELEARIGAQDRFRDFLQTIDQANEREIPRGGALAGENATPAESNPREAIPFILRALSLYGVLQQEDWPARLEDGWLEPGHVAQVRRSVYEKLLLLADDVLNRNEDHATGGKLPQDAAARQALAYLKRAEAIPPATRALYWVRARCWKQIGDAGAAKIDEQRVKDAPALVAVDHYLPGDVAHRNGMNARDRNDKAKHKAEAIGEFEAALRVDPSDYWSLMKLGYCLCDLGQGQEPAEAVRVFTGCISRRPDHAYVYRCRGLAYSALGLYDKSLADYSKALEMKPDYMEAWGSRGVLYTDRLNQPAKGVADFSKAIALKPDDAKARYNRGVAYGKLRLYDKSLADYTKAIELKPDFASAWNNRGILYTDHLNHPDKGVGEFSKAIELQPEDGMLWFHRGNAYRKLRRHDKAVADYSQALKLLKAQRGPEDQFTLGTMLNLVSAYTEAGKRDNAVTLGEELVAILRKLADKDLRNLAHQCMLGGALDNLGEAQAALGRHKEALENLQEAIKHQRRAFDKAPQVTRYRQFLSTHYWRLARVQRELGRPADAAAASLECRKLWPGNSTRLYDVACDLALCVPLVGKGKLQLSPEEQAERQKYADQAMDVLREAVKHGWKDAAHMKKDPDLDPLREREDFKKLMAELEEKVKKESGVKSQESEKTEKPK